MSARAGMTLVELLTGLVIAALIATILTSSLVQIFDRAGRLERAREAVENDLAAVSAFRRLVERAVMLPPGDPDEQGAAGFQMTGAALYWVAVEQGYPGSAGLYAYGLETVRDAAGWSLVLRRAPLPADYPGETALEEILTGTEPTPIWTGSASAHFMAFDPEDRGWVSHWGFDRAPPVVGLVLPGLPMAVARLPQADLAAPGRTGDQDRPGIGAIEQAAGGMP